MPGHQNLIDKLQTVADYAAYIGEGNANGVIVRAIRDLKTAPPILFEDAFDEAFNPAMRAPEPAPAEPAETV